MNKEDMHKLVSEQQPNICQIVASVNGDTVYSDQWNRYLQKDACHVMSVTKSVMSILVGIAVDNGFIDGVDSTVLSFFPEYKIKRGEKTIQDVTIRHMLTMTAPYKYKYEPWSKICSSDDWTYSALDFLGGRSGIKGEFKYSTLGVHILSGIISRTSGLKTVDFANKYLFDPIGVARHSCFFAQTAEEHKRFTISKQPRENVWFCDPQQIATAGFGLCLSAADMEKIGRLCLNGGKCDGRQVVSSEWIGEMSAVRCRCDEEFRGMSYGYLWWIIDEKKGVYAAIGNSGNVICINPAEKTVIAVTSYFKPTIFDRIDFIQQYIEPMILDRD